MQHTSLSELLSSMICIDKWIVNDLRIQYDHVISFVIAPWLIPIQNCSVTFSFSFNGNACFMFSWLFLRKLDETESFWNLMEVPLKFQKIGLLSSTAAKEFWSQCYGFLQHPGLCYTANICASKRSTWTFMQSKNVWHR